MSSEETWRIVLPYGTAVEQDSGCPSDSHGQEPGSIGPPFYQERSKGQPAPWKIIRESKDEHLDVIIYDYDSQDIDLKQALRRSTSQNYKYITKPGKYSPLESFSEAIQSILNPEAIMVTMP